MSEMLSKQAVRSAGCKAETKGRGDRREEAGEEGAEEGGRAQQQGGGVTVDQGGSGQTGGGQEVQAVEEDGQRTRLLWETLTVQGLVNQRHEGRGRHQGWLGLGGSWATSKSKVRESPRAQNREVKRQRKAERVSSRCGRELQSWKRNRGDKNFGDRNAQRQQRE